MITTFSAKAGAVLIISHEKCLYSYIFYVYIMPSTWLQTPKSQKCVISASSDYSIKTMPTKDAAEWHYKGVWAHGSKYHF